MRAECATTATPHCSAALCACTHVRWGPAGSGLRGRASGQSLPAGTADGHEAAAAEAAGR